MIHHSLSVCVHECTRLRLLFCMLAGPIATQLCVSEGLCSHDDSQLWGAAQPACPATALACVAQACCCCCCCEGLPVTRLSSRSSGLLPRGAGAWSTLVPACARHVPQEGLQFHVCPAATTFLIVLPGAFVGTTCSGFCKPACQFFTWTLSCSASTHAKVLERHVHVLCCKHCTGRNAVLCLCM
jgi:hypothetical protein